MATTVDAQKTGLYNPANVAITGGTIKVNDGSAAAPSYSFASFPNDGFYAPANDNISVAIAGSGYFTFNALGLEIAAGTALAWSDTAGTTYGTGKDLTLYRDAANTLAQRNGTNAQAFRVYNTYTDGSNYERFAVSWSANTLSLISEAAGTGSLRALRIGPTGFLWEFAGAGLIPLTDGALDVGSNTAHIKRLYIDYTNTGTVGAVTINKAAGRVNIAAAATSIVVTNSLVTAASKVLVTAAQADANNPLIRSVVPGAGSFTITVSTAPAANQAYDFFVVNAD